jgi:hypothetical protein
MAKRKRTNKTKDRVTRTPLKTWGKLRYSRRVNSSCSTSGTCPVTLVTNLTDIHLIQIKLTKISYIEPLF